MNETDKINNSNWTDWCTIQGVVRGDDLTLRVQ